MNNIVDLNNSVDFLNSEGFQVVSLNKIEKFYEITALCLPTYLFITPNVYKICDILSDNSLFENINFKEDFSSLSECFLACLSATFDREEDCKSIVDQALWKSIGNTSLDYFNKLKEKKHTFKFNSESKMSGTVREFQNELQIFAQGSPEIILEKSSFILKNGKKEEMNESDLDYIKKKIQNIGKRFK